MVLLKSLDLPMGSEMPAFVLNDPDGKSYASDDVFGAKGLLVAFTCNHCPYAIAIWDRLIELSKWAEGQRVKTVAINPNINPNYPDDSPEKMKEKISEWGIPFPYLVDETQGVAKDFQAQCTPDLYLYDASKRLFYHGQLDDNWQDESKVKKQDLKLAIEDLVAGREHLGPDFPAMGCSIKWRNNQ